MFLKDEWNPSQVTPCVTKVSGTEPIFAIIGLYTSGNHCLLFTIHNYSAVPSPLCFQVYFIYLTSDISHSLNVVLFLCLSLSLPCYPILPSPFFSLSYHFLVFSLSFNTMEPGTKAPLRELPINFPALEYWIVSLCLGNASQSATSLLPLDPMFCWKVLQHLTLSSLSQPTSSSGTTDTFN